MVAESKRKSQLRAANILRGCFENHFEVVDRDKQKRGLDFHTDARRLIHRFRMPWLEELGRLRLVEPQKGRGARLGERRVVLPGRSAVAQ